MPLPNDYRNEQRPDQMEPVEEPKKVKGLSRAASKVMYLIIIVVIGLVLMPSSVFKKKEEEKQITYTMADPDAELKPRPKDPVPVTPATPPPPPINFQIDHPTPPKQTPPPRKKRVRQPNPYLAQWLAQQRQSFTAGPNVSTWGGGAGAARTGGSNADSRSQRDKLLDLYAKQLEQDGNKDSVTKTEQEKFFENAGRSTVGVLPFTRTSKPAPYTLPAGTMIPCALVSGINTDLPGNITAQVTENVYDWQDPLAVLIPQGTRVWGIYNSQTEFAQKRVQVVWSRLIFPDGSTLNLNGMPGVDTSGFSGMKDQYNMHINSMLTAAVLVSAFSAVGEIFNKDKNNTVIISGGGTNAATVESAVAQSIAGMGEKIFSKFVDRRPTIVIRPGFKFNIQANADIPFTRIWAAKEQRW